MLKRFSDHFRSFLILIWSNLQRCDFTGLNKPSREKSSGGRGGIQPIVSLLLSSLHFENNYLMLTQMNYQSQWLSPTIWMGLWFWTIKNNSKTSKQAVGNFRYRHSDSSEIFFWKRKIFLNDLMYLRCARLRHQNRIFFKFNAFNGKSGRIFFRL